jgi:peptidoglycan/LPS O-acetylase OafA/YrhL
MQKQRLLYLAQTVVVTVVMFRGPSLAGSERGAELIFDVSAVILSWSCAVTAIGYARRYLNHNSPLRKNANEAIYPFYLLHQPVIVVVAYMFVNLNIALLWKVLLITACSFSLIVSFYWFVIKPFNPLRIIFGMKKTTTSEKVKCFIIDGERPLENAERA